MEKIDESIKQQAYRLLTPNDTLDVRLFDPRKSLHPDVKKILLNNTHYILQKTVDNIPGLVINDICLIGSSAGYFYHEKSDVDIKIAIENKNCPWLTQDEEKLAKFLKYSFIGVFSDFRFNLYDRFVDVKLECSYDENIHTGLYSLLYDKWIDVPDKNIFSGLTIDEVLEAYINKYQEIMAYLEAFQRYNLFQSKEELEKLKDFFYKLVKESRCDKKTYIVFKLLNYKKVFNVIKNTYSEAVKKYLSIYD